MPFYEITYETGRMSVAFYEDDEEAKSAIGEQHRRAVAGLPGGPINQPAERIAAVRIYDKHPDDWNTEQTLSADVASKEVERLIKEGKDENGVINTFQLALRVQDLSHPMVDSRENSFDSMYRMKEKSTMKLDFLEEASK